MSSGLLTTERLELVQLPAYVLAGVLAGRVGEVELLIGARVPADWPGDDAEFFALRRDQLQHQPDHTPWALRALVLREERRVVGHVGLHGPPGVNALDDAEAVEIGYALNEDDQHQGYATEAVAAVIRWAFEQPGVERILATVAPDNEPSRAVVARLGFTYVTSVDESEQREDVYALER